MPPPGDGKTIRSNLLEAVRRDPGLCKREAQGRLGIAWGTLHYHLERLVSDGLVTLHRDGPRRHLFPSGWSPQRRRQAALLRDPVAACILEVLHKRSRCRGYEIVRETGVTERVARLRLRQLEEAGSVLRRGVRFAVYEAAGPVPPPRKGPAPPAAPPHTARAACHA